jgi:DNA-binding NarL/FixJ family response regulator
MPRVSNFLSRGPTTAQVSANNSAEPAGLDSEPRPAIHSQVLELVRQGLKVHDISALLGVHPRVVAKVTPLRGRDDL